MGEQSQRRAEPRSLTYNQWRAEGEKLFGTDMMEWKFRCPVCGHEASAREYKEAGAPEGAVGFSCIGRWLDKSKDAFQGEGSGPCNYAGGGLFRLNPVTVTHDDGKQFEAFEFAEVGNG